MKIRVGFEMLYDFPQPTPMIMVLGTHFTRASDIIVPDHLTISPAVPVFPYRDGFGNWCSRIVAPAGRVRLAADGVVRDSGLPDPVVASATQHAVEDLPADTLVYLLGSRYCETDRLSEVAWSLFQNTQPAGRGFRPSAISSIVTSLSATNTPAPPRPAWEAFMNGKGVCRDYAHLPCRLGGAGVFVAESDVTMDEIADGLNPRPARLSILEKAPRDFRKAVGLQ